MRSSLDRHHILYLYCLGCSQDLSAIEGEGLDTEGPLFVYPQKEITAVLSHVPLSDYSGAGAAQQLQDIRWIGPRVLKHEQITEQVWNYSTILPARFATLFSSYEQLDRFMETHYDVILASLHKMKDKEEWAVKGFIDQKKMLQHRLSQQLADQAETLEALAPGHRYFQEKQISKEVEQTFQAWIRQQSHETVQSLLRQNIEIEEHPLLSREASGKELDMISNWGVLLPKTHAASLKKEFAILNQKNQDTGLLFEISGPWPPYSFCPQFQLNK